MMKLLLLSAGLLIAMACGSNGDGGSGASDGVTENQVSLTPPDFPLIQVIEEENKN